MFDKIIIFFDRALKDMSTKFKFLLATPIKWPDRCAACNKNPVEYKGLCKRVFRNNPYWGDLLGLLTIRYPIKIVTSVPLCRHHSFQMDCMQILSFCSFVSMLLFAVLTFAKFFYQEVQSSYFHAIVYLFISIVSLVIYIYSLIRKPVRLKEVGDIFFTIVIKDKDYAKEFASINDYNSQK